MKLKHYFSLETEVLAFGGPDGKTTSNQPIFFIGVLLGALAKVAYDHFNGKAPFAWGSLAIAAIGSLVTFPMIYKRAGLSKMGRLTFAKWCVAFQYGFFWQFVFQEIEKKLAGA
jgi:hypothetical protein